MKILKAILWAVTSGLFWILIAYWSVFVYYTIVYFFQGGSDRVVQWYMHTSGGIPFLSVSNGKAVLSLTPWSPRKFVAS